MKNTIILSIIILVSYIPSSFGQVLTISDGQVDPESTATLTNSYHDEVIFEDQGGTLNISQTGNGSYAGDIWQQNLAAGASANLEINSPGAVIQLPGLAASPPVLVPISGMVTINGGTLQGSTSPNALLNLAVSGAVYELGGDQTVSDLAGAQGSSISLGGNTLTVGYNNGVFMGTQTFAGDITGTGGVIFNGEETYILTGTNTYTGGTQINGDGTLQGTTDSLPAGGPIENNATLSIVQASSGTYTGDISGSGGVSISAAGETISFTGTNTYTGGTSLNDGTLEVINGAFPGTINVGSNLTFNQSASASFGGQIFGDGAVFITGGFPLTLTGEDPFSGVMTINNDGSTLIGNTSSIQGNVTNNSMLTFNQSGTGTYGGVINGTGAVTIAGGGALTFTGNNTYTGGTTINDDGSNLIVSAPTSTSPITPGNITGNVTNNGTLTFNQIGGATPLSYSFPGDITGTGGVAIEGSTGQFTLSLTGKNNTYSGATTLNTPVGTLQGSFPESQLSLTAGTYDLGTADHTIGSLTGTTASVVNLEANTLTMGGDNSTTTFYGTIIDAGTGAGSIVKNGSGTLTLALTPTYTGSTTIRGGTLQVGESSSPGTLPSTDLYVNGGTLTMLLSQNFATLSGTGGTIDMGTSTTTPLTLGIQGNSPTSGFAGTITGTGNLIIGLSGPASLTLTGNNTFTGGTIINAGSSLTAPLSSLPAPQTGAVNSGQVTNSGTLTLTQGGTFAGAIIGSGSVTIQGGSEVIYTGGNTYTEGTTIANDGSSLTGSTSTLPPGGPIVVGPTTDPTANASLILNQTSDSSNAFTGNISGLGSVTIQGGQTITFTGNNTYTGGTTIANDGSNLNVTAGTSATSNIPLTGAAITDNGTLTFNQTVAGAVTFAVPIQGSGNLIVNGPGTIDFSNSSITPSAIVNGGGIVGNTQAFLGDITLNNATLTFDQSVLGTYNKSISGTGTVNCIGSGTVTFPGDQAYSGTTHIGNKSTLIVNGRIPNSSVMVDEGGTLGGAGTIRFLDLRGTLSPGTTIGNITIITDHTSRHTAMHRIEVSSDGTSDQVLVARQAQLDGSLNVISTENRQDLKGKEFTFLTAGKGVTGQFSTLISNNRLKYLVQYDPTNVKIIVGNMQDFTDAFSPRNTSNAEKTATYFDTFADNTNLSPDLTSVINGLDTLLATGDSAAVQNAFNQIQPSQYKELGQISFLNNEVVNRTVGSQQQNLRESLWVEKELEAYAGSAAISPQRVASFHHLAKSAKGFKSSSILQARSQPHHRLGMLALPGSERVGMPANNWIKLGRSSVWVQSYGQIERTKGNHGNAGIRSETGGISLGGDHEVLKNTYLGFLGGMSTTPFHWQQGRGSGRVKSYYGGIYGTWLSQTGFYADGQLIAGGNNYNSHRNIVYPGVNRKARQSHNGGQFSTDLQAGYVWSLKHLTVQPYADATYMFVNESGFREKGAQSLDFKIKGRMSQFFRGEIGAQVYKTYVLCDALVRPALQLSWVHKRSMGPNSAKVQGGLVGQAQSLSVAGDNRTRNQVAPGLALTVQFAKGLYVIGNVSSQFGGGQKLGDALIRVGYDF